ncbi:SymE family type I addiction module toxin [Winslowiella iniecta]|uniref:Growth inhibitor PemK n=1 Tax=Winslowiella iniecta TaxID=1560201 RepID=A0A0L7SWX6_9GAMM|nr:SymE family type I addiction module toxin [Winslowiella iniecta]KOC87679.1 growth inhibitor PemK [Winslowiella iniecta]KOC89851.1 growth inhibitor PemK [Winslowiella iniecta]
MAEHDFKSGQGISKTERRCIVGYRPQRDANSTPAVNLSGKWLREAGFEVGTGVSLKVMDGCLMLIPDGPEERRLWAKEQQLKSQQEELGQARQRIKAVLA